MLLLLKATIQEEPLSVSDEQYLVQARPTDNRESYMDELHLNCDVHIYTGELRPGKATLVYIHCIKMPCRMSVFIDYIIVQELLTTK